MEENRHPNQLPLILSHTTKVEKVCLWQFSALSALLHAVALAIFLIWTGERLRHQSPVQVISVDLSQLEPSQPQMAPPQTHPPVQPLAPAATVRPTPNQSPAAADMQPTTSAAVPPAAMAATTPASPGAPAVMPVRPAPGTATVKSGTPVPAAEHAPATPVPVPHPIRTADIAGIRASYMQRCRGLIEHYKEYPVMARKGMIEGTVVIQGMLVRDGSLRQCSVKKTSGSSLLDNAALRAVRSVGRFPQLPSALHGDELVFELPVSFRLSTE